MSQTAEPAETEVSEKKGISRKESLAILSASLMAAVSALLATVIAQRSLSGEENTEFLLFWSLLFGIFGIIAGIQQETTRAVGAAHLAGSTRGRRQDAGARVLPASLGIGAVVAVLVLVSSPLWVATQIPGTMWAGVGLVALGALLYSAHSAMSGAAAGRECWYSFALLGGGEAAWRLLALAAVGLLVGSLLGLQAAVVSASLLWLLLLLVSGSARSIAGARADVGTGRYVRNVLFAMGSSAASAVLTVAFPTLLNASQGSEVDAHTKTVLGVLVLAISITRSPIMIPLQAFQGVAISAFLKQSHRPIAAMAKPVAALLGVGLVGCLAAWLIGPWLFTLIYQPQPETLEAYDVIAQGWVLGLLTLASAVMALLVLSGTAVLALNAHRLYTVGWAIAAFTSTLLLFILPLELVPRAMVSLYLGPALGFATHLAGMVVLARRK